VEVFSFFERNLEVSPDKKALTVKINHLYMYEELTDNGQSMGIVEFNMDFYTKEGEIYFLEFSAGGHRKFTSELAEEKFDKFLAKTIEECLLEFQARVAKNLCYHRLVTEKELFSNSINETLELETLNQFRERGLYYSFNDFRDNITDADAVFYTKKYGNDKFEDAGYLKFKEDEDGIRKKDVWGFFENNTVYVQYAEIFIPLNATDSGFILKSVPSNALPAGSSIGIVAGGMAFGLIGVAVASGIGAAAGSREIKNTAYKIDLTTGLIAPYASSKYEKIHAELLFYAQRFNDEKQQFDLYFNDEYYCSFQPNTYATIIVGHDENPVKICLKSPTDEYCEDITADMFNTMYFEAIINKKGKVELFPNRSESTIISIQRRIEEESLTPICTDE
jgi:hypothetical protein